LSYVGLIGKIVDPNLTKKKTLLELPLIFKVYSTGLYILPELNQA